MSEVLAWFENLHLDLANRLNKGGLHHALLITGIENLGKSSYTFELAKKIVCEDKDSLEACGVCKSCSLAQAGSHPDLHQVVSDKAQIGIDLIRQAIERLNKTAQLSGNKVLTIANADRMTESAANSLLKTLEEPSANTFLIMSSSYPERLLPTILSRCEKIMVQTPSLEMSTKWLSSQSVTLNNGHALRAFKGSPLAYKQNLDDKTALNYLDFEQLIDQLKGHQGVVNKAATQWKDNARNLINWLAQYYFEQYRNTHKQGYFDSYQQCIDASKKLNHAGLNRVLILTALLNRVALDC